jgi:glucosamine 6-phosphate synthetase-like amidotransferase/phosphosugar isomerase protein
MAFLYLIDLITSISLHVIVKCSSWIIYSSGNGLYYLYKKIRPGSQITNKFVTIDDNDFVIITRQEYNKLLNNQHDISETDKTESKNTNQQ